jgi:hypothetical protein
MQHGIGQLLLKKQERNDLSNTRFGCGDKVERKYPKLKPSPRLRAFFIE